MRSRFQWLIPVFFSMLLAAMGASGQTLLDIHKEAEIPCTACHQEEPFVAPPNEVCVTCHGTKLEAEEDEASSRPDPHLALQLEEGQIPPCATCHSVHGGAE